MIPVFPTFLQLLLCSALVLSGDQRAESGPKQGGRFRTHPKMQQDGPIWELRKEVPIFRFSKARACSDDFFTVEGGRSVQHYPDPVCGTWNEGDGPRRGYSCFSLKSYSSVSSSKCSVLNCVTLPDGWRLRYTHDLSFLTATGVVARARHYILYSAVPKGVAEFIDGIDQLPWEKCETSQDDLAFSLCDSHDAEMGQPVNANVDAVRMCNCMIQSSNLNDLECFLLACTYCELALDMSPLRFHPLPLLEKTLHIVRRHEPPRGHFMLMYEYHEALCKYLEKAIRWKGFEPDRDERVGADSSPLSGFSSEEDDDGGEEEEGQAAGDVATSQAPRLSGSEHPPSTGSLSVPSAGPLSH